MEFRAKIQKAPIDTSRRRCILEKTENVKLSHIFLTKKVLLIEKRKIEKRIKLFLKKTGDVI